MRYVFFVAAFMAPLLAAGASAKVLRVDRNVSSASPDGLSWSTAFPTVTGALAVATSGDEVWVADGVYAERLSPGSGVALYGGFAGTEAQRDQRNWTANAVVIDGGASTTEAVVTCGDNTLVDGFTLRNGLHGVYALYATVTIANNVVTGNNGNGVFLFQGTGTVSGNTVTGNGGDGVGTSGSTTTLERNMISSNGRHGVAVGSGPVTIANNTISGNAANGATVGEGFDPVILAGNTVSGNGLDGIRTGNSKLTLANNTVAFNVRYGVARTGGSLVSFSHNNVYGNTEADLLDLVFPAGLGNISLDPKLSNRYHDVHIQPDSPCINAGDTAASLGTTDIDNQPRVQGSRVDIGADESNGTAWAAPLVWRVSTTGNDDNDGGSWDKAKRTIATALALGQGQGEVWVAKGVYAERVMPPPGVAVYGGFAGMETSRTQRNASANPTVLDGGGGATETLVTFRFPDTVLDGFTLRGARHAVSVVGGTPIMAHCAFYDNSGSAVTISGGSLVTIADNVFNDNGDGAFDHAIRVESVESVIVTRNVFTNNAVSLAVSNGSATVTHNRFAGNYTGISVQEGGYATISNNNINHNRTGVGVSASFTVLANNTVAYNQAGVFIDTGATALENNIIAFNSYYGVNRFGSGSIVTFSHNNVARNTPEDFKDFTPPPDRGNISADPLFTDQWTSDYHLLAGSPSIDAGDNAAVTLGSTDMDGKPRIIGPRVDMGAFEFGVPGTMPFTIVDVRKALEIAGGLLTAGSADWTRLDIGPADSRITLSDAARITRKAVGLEANP